MARKALTAMDIFNEVKEEELQNEEAGEYLRTKIEIEEFDQKVRNQ